MVAISTNWREGSMIAVIIIIIIILLRAGLVNPEMYNDPSMWACQECSQCRHVDKTNETFFIDK